MTRIQCAQVTRRPATRRDDGYLRTLFADTRDDLLILPADVRDSLIDMQFRALRRRVADRHPEATDEVLVADGVDAGQLIVDRAGESVHVVDLIVGRRHRGRGVASAALRDLIASAGDRSVTLRLWSGNTAARGLYEQLGFVCRPDGSGYLDLELPPRPRRTS